MDPAITPGRRVVRLWVLISAFTPWLVLCSCSTPPQRAPTAMIHHDPAPASPAAVKAWVVSDRWPDSRTPETFAQGILRIEAADIQCDEDRAIFLYKWMNRCYGRSGKAEEGPAGVEGYLVDNWANFHCYGQGHCDPTGRLFAAIARGAGFPAHKATTPAHTMTEIYYTDRDGVDRWHLFDPILGFYIYSRDGSRIASAAELGENADLFFNYTKVSQPYFVRDKTPRLPYIPDPEEVRSRQRWFRNIMATRVWPAEHDVRMNIPTGASFTRYWSRLPGAWYSQKSQRMNQNHCTAGWHDPTPPFYEDGAVKDPFNYPYWKNYLIDCDACGAKSAKPAGHGVFTWRPPLVGEDFGKEAFLCENVVAGDSPDKPRVHAARPGQQGTLIYEVTSPYVIAASKITARVWRSSTDWSTDIGFYFSLDRGRTWHQATNSRKKPDKVAAAAARGIQSIGKIVQDTPFDIEIDLGRDRWEAGEASVYGTYGFLLRIDMLGRKDPTVAGLEDLVIENIVQLNMWTLPFLQGGRNTISVTADALAPGREMVVSYAWDDLAGKDRKAAHTFDRLPGQWSIDVSAAGPEDIHMKWVKLEVPGPPQPMRTFSTLAVDPPRPEDCRLACPPVASPPVLDGKLDDEAWLAAGRIDSLLDRHNRPADGPTRTTIRACRDANNLYLAFDCFEPNAEPLNTIITQRDGQVHKDNHVKLSIAAGNGAYWEITVNSNGCVADTFFEKPGAKGEADRNLPIRAAGRREHARGGSWQLELAIPLKELALDPSGGPGRINIMRSIWGDRLGYGNVEEGQVLSPSPGVNGFGYIDFQDRQHAEGS